MDECVGDDDGEFSPQRKDLETCNDSCGETRDTNVLYLPQNAVLCKPWHNNFESCVTAGPSESGLVSKWHPKDQVETKSAALVLCLNIGIDPPEPDYFKISPCARMECWIDPFSMVPDKALRAIAKKLLSQYRKWQPRADYQCEVYPTLEAVKELCDSRRECVKSGRVLFHYNGHGVPKPTSKGEIWLFKSKKEYIPLKVTELDSWLKTPSIYVFDCSSAGMVVDAFIELQDLSASDSSGPSQDCILLAACEAHQTLPQSSEFPADVFTSCLTTPLNMALRWFCNRSLLSESFNYSLLNEIPGLNSDGKKLVAELHRIFTAVTDRIAWNILPHDLFQRLFRQDILVTNLFRNFLLAERIMRSANCVPVSYPMLPASHQHHMWKAWDMVIETCLSQLRLLVDDPKMEFQPSTFFPDQLTAFEVWLNGCQHEKPPEQLPILCQALQSPSHQLRAMVLLGRFLDMGSWALDLALSVGLYSYFLSLLQTTDPELRKTLVFIWTKILALDKSCQVDLVKNEGHTCFIRFLDCLEAYPEHRAMSGFVLAVIVDGHRDGQKACKQAGLIHVCLKHLQCVTPNGAPTDALFLRCLCLCLGKLFEGFTEAQLLGLEAEAPTKLASLLSAPQPEVRASAVFALGTLLDAGFNSSTDDVGRDVGFDDDQKIRTEVYIVKSLCNIVSDGSQLVRAEVTAALAHFASGHNKYLNLKSVVDAYLKSQFNPVPSSLPSLAQIKSSVFGMNTTSSRMSPSSMIPTPIGHVWSVVGDKVSIPRDRRASSSSPLATSGVMHGSPLPDDSSLQYDSGILNDNVGNESDNQVRSRQPGKDTCIQFVLAMSNLAQDPSPLIARLGRRVLSIIGIEQRSSSSHSVESTKTQPPFLAPLARSSSWFDMKGGHLPVKVTTPPISPPRPSNLTGMRRVCSLGYKTHLMSSPDPGLSDLLLGSLVSSDVSKLGLLPQSSIYNWTRAHFSKPVLTISDDSEEILVEREERRRLALDHILKSQLSSVSKINNQTASWDTKFERGPRTALMHSFSPVVIAADENEKIRVWNYEEGTLLNSFDNHNYLDKGVSKLCAVNELDDSLLLVASCDGNIRIWKDYTIKGKQKLATAFSSIQGHRPGARSINAVVDWQQQSGCVFASGEISSIVAWDLDKEQLVNTIPSISDCRVSALAASQVHGGLFVAGFVDGYIRLFDTRIPEMIVFETRPHTQKDEEVVGIGLQPGLGPTKIVSASQAGEINLFDTRIQTGPYSKVTAGQGSLTALAVHPHTPIFATGSANQIIEVFDLEAEQLCNIDIGSVSCLAFHPYQILFAAGATDALVSIYSNESAESL